MSLDCEIKEVITQDFLHGAQSAVGVWASKKIQKMCSIIRDFIRDFFFFPVLESEEKPARDLVSSSLSPLISFNRSNLIIV